MDSELMRSLGDAFTKATESKIKLTPQAFILITDLIETLADDPKRKSESSVLRALQVKAINNLPGNLQRISRLYNSQIVSAPMVVGVLPRLISAFCPPFESPPPE